MLDDNTLPFSADLKTFTVRQQTHITVGYFIYATSDNSHTQVYKDYAEMFDDMPGRDSLMVREIVHQVSADNIYITPCYVVKKIVDDVSDDCGVSFKYEVVA